MAHPNENYIVSCLRRGFNTSQIAEGLGQTQSAVTQLIAAHGLTEKAALESRYDTLDSQYDSLEEKALKKLSHALDYQECTPTQLSVIVSRLNGAKRRSLQEVANGGSASDIVQISIPKHLKVEVTVSAQNEVLAVGERVLNTMPLQSVQALSKQRQALPPVNSVADFLEHNNLFNLQKEQAS